MGKKIDHSSIEDSRQRQVAADIIDIVEAAIREANPQVEELASTWKPEEDVENPNTLLYGEAYYALEEEVAVALREDIAKRCKSEVEE